MLLGDRLALEWVRILHAILQKLFLTFFEIPKIEHEINTLFRHARLQCAQCCRAQTVCTLFSILKIFFQISKFLKKAITHWAPNLGVPKLGVPKLGFPKLGEPN